MLSTIVTISLSSPSLRVDDELFPEAEELLDDELFPEAEEPLDDEFELLPDELLELLPEELLSELLSD